MSLPPYTSSPEQAIEYGPDYFSAGKWRDIFNFRQYWGGDCAKPYHIRKRVTANGFSISADVDFLTKL